MEAEWLVATTYIHADGSASVTVVNTAEGSSRATATHNILDVRSSDVPYEDPDTKLRTHYRKLNEAHERGTTRLIDRGVAVLSALATSSCALRSRGRMALA